MHAGKKTKAHILKEHAEYVAASSLSTLTAILHTPPWHVGIVLGCFPVQQLIKYNVHCFLPLDKVQ